MKTKEKHSKSKLIYDSERLKLLLAIGALAFIILWKLTYWIRSHHNENQEWSHSDQFSMEVSLPPEQKEKKPVAEEEEKQTNLLDGAAYLPEPIQFTVKPGDNLAAHFQQAGLDSKILHEVLAIDKKHSLYLKKIYPGQNLQIQTNHQEEFLSLQLDIDPITSLIVERQNNGKLLSRLEDKPVEKRIAFGGGKIHDSLFMAGKHAKLDDTLIMELASVFAYDIDFAQDIKPNDSFKVLFEEHFVNGEKIGNGSIVAAEFYTNGKKYQAIRYQDGNGQPVYYAPNGKSLKKAFIRTPVEYTRISSHFNLKRQHPVLHTIRAHRGVDYAAPTGTPVKAAGNGKVIFAGKKGGYGNVIILQHGTKYTTLYGHLSGFTKNLKKGKTISQGEIIGYVGSTGLASGPHLHFEFRVDGVHHDPLTVAIPYADGVSDKSKSQFLAYSKGLLKQMDKQSKVLIARNEL